MNMSSSATVSSALEVRQDGQLLPSGSNVNFGDLQTGAHVDKTFLVQQNGPGILSFSGISSPSIAGPQSDQFSVEVQLMPWQQLLGINTVYAFMVRYAPTIAGSKAAILSLSNSDQTYGGYALQLSGSAVGDPVGGGESSAEASGSPDLVQGQSLYAVNCASCHGSLSISTKSGATIERISAALNTVTGIPEMRTLVLSTEQLQKIVLALNTPVQQADKPTAPYVVNVGTAPYVASKLARWFLPPGPPSGYAPSDTAVWDIISQGVLGRTLSGGTVGGRRDYFQGRCQRFDTACRSEEMDDLMRPVPDTIRGGLVVRVCSLLIDNTQAVNNALGKVGLTTSSELSVANVKLLHDQLFGEGRPELPLYKAQAIHAFPNGAPGFTLADKWKFMLGYFCTLDQLLENV